MICRDYSSICVVVPTHNRFDKTKNCINRLSECYPFVTIYVCDSNSTDGTREFLAQAENVIVVPAGENWWTGACNLGVQCALSDGFDLILLLNDDIDFDDDFIDRLIAKNIEYPRSILSVSQDSPFGVFLGHKYLGFSKSLQSVPLCSSDCIVDTSNGCCLLVPSCVFNSVGLFDAINCPHLYADTVFQLLAKRAGFETYAIPSIRIKQHESTDYISRVQLNSIFSSPGSPFNLRSFLKFGEVLFCGKHRFALFGFKYSVPFVVSLLRTVVKLVFKS
jgi:GT2 family glycosyltransferase